MAVINKLSVLNFSHLFREDIPPLLRIALPLILTGFVHASVSFCNNIFLAHLGANTLAAGALVMGLYTTFFVIIYGLFSAINVLISYEFGGNHFSAIPDILRDGFALTVAIAVPTYFAFWHVAALFHLITDNQEVVQLAEIYLRSVVWGLFFELMGCLVLEFLLGVGGQRLILIASLVAVPLYIGLSYVLIYGKWGFPELGIAGAGWGRSLANMIVTPLLCLYLLLNKNYNHFILPIFSLKKFKYFWEILNVGVPIGIMHFIEICFYFVLTVIMGTISINALAANQVTMQYVEPTIAAALAIGQGITVRLALQLGAGEYHFVKRIVFAGVTFSFLFMLVIGLIYWIFPYQLVGIYFKANQPNNANIVALAIGYLSISAFFQVSEAIRIAFYASLRALKDTRFCLISSIICFWLISIPLGYVFAFQFGLSGNGFWLAMIVGACLNAVLLYRRLNIKHFFYHR